MLRGFWLLILVVFVAGVACGESDSKDPVSVVPTYEITADGVTCGEGARVASSASDSCSIQICDWYCAAYKDQELVHVSLTFRKCTDTDTAWVLDSETVMQSDRATCDVLQRP